MVKVSVIPIRHNVCSQDREKKNSIIQIPIDCNHIAIHFKDFYKG